MALLLLNRHVDENAFVSGEMRSEGLQSSIGQLGNYQ
jgi:hypothetical protein